MHHFYSSPILAWCPAFHIRRIVYSIGQMRKHMLQQIAELWLAAEKSGRGLTPNAADQDKSAAKNFRPDRYQLEMLPVRKKAPKKRLPTAI